MAAKTDCRHYQTRSLATGDQLQICRLDAAQTTPFACPDDCVFFEPRSGMTAGWTVQGGLDG
jgi:hypothetical protein